MPAASFAAPDLRHELIPQLVAGDKIFKGANELQQWIVARKLIGRDVTG